MISHPRVHRAYLSGFSRSLYWKNTTFSAPAISVKRNSGFFQKWKWDSSKVVQHATNCDAPLSKVTLRCHQILLQSRKVTLHHDQMLLSFFLSFFSFLFFSFLFFSFLFFSFLFFSFLFFSFLFFSFLFFSFLFFSFLFFSFFLSVLTSKFISVAFSFYCFSFLLRTIRISIIRISIIWRFLT